MVILLAIPFKISALEKSGRYFDRAIFVIFENTNYANAIKQPFFKQLADNGAHFSNFMALTHPSQGNYVGLTSGSLNGVSGDGRYDLDVNSIADLLEAKGLTWKVYAEGFPGNCYLGAFSAKYARKHNPFISYVNIQRSPSRCANIVNASQFDQDAASGSLPNYVFYIPDENNDGHDTGVTFADTWYRGKFSSYVNDSSFMAKTVLISTFDESGWSAKNQIYTSIVGPAVKPGVISDNVNLYSLLSLIEQNWNLGNLGKEDVNATSIPNIWK
jgi:Phosphoesterase family